MTPLPKGCKVFLMEVFAGGAVFPAHAASCGNSVDLNLDSANLIDPYFTFGKPIGQ